MSVVDKDAGFQVLLWLIGYQGEILIPNHVKLSETGLKLSRLYCVKQILRSYPEIALRRSIGLVEFSEMLIDKGFSKDDVNDLLRDASSLESKFWFLLVDMPTGKINVKV